MSERIPEETIEEIRSSLDIVDVISEYVQLKKQGRNFIGLCPFHGEKTPSFSVSQDKQLYHCFGCGAGGNAFSFVMEYDGLSFIEAVQKLAPKTNVTLPELSIPVNKSEVSDEWKHWYDGHDLAAKLYHHILTSSPEGKKAREYLRKRGFTKTMIDEFQIGYSPDSWSFLSDFLLKRGLKAEDMANCGLVGLRESDGKPFDRFRDRIMFPIWDKQGKVIAFGGRILDPDSEPKYLNSPDSEVFNKGNLLYYFHGARPKMKKKNEAVLFEGYIDVISAHRAGIDYGVGALGTALTESQAKMLRRNVDRVILCYDSDNAGMQATWKNAEILQKAGLEVVVANLPEGYDPDDYIREQGADRFVHDVINRHQTLMAFKSSFLKRGKNVSTEADRLLYMEQMLKEIAKLPKALERDFYIKQLSDDFSVSPEVLKHELSELMAKKEKTVRKEAYKEIQSRTVASAKKMFDAHEAAERHLITLMLQSRSIAEEIEKEIGANFQLEEYQALAALLYSFYGEGYDTNPSSFLERLEDPSLRKLAAELAMKQVNLDLSEQELHDYFKHIRLYPLKQELKELRVQLDQVKEIDERMSIANRILAIQLQLKKAK
ncbi:DNA primase [Paenalkalicoccus suaedae]|uniref:DNA primase n=1 Tax=Paenalkalicoccus suaedae TaxID=2592382 RepID=A0A859FDQ6_9BACI|nr:DNA primase [Paenalkalicoccus suaedae]QKS70872.1 DNA primase [Paenalkalicoccus suaedae]